MRAPQPHRRYRGYPPMLHAEGHTLLGVTITSDGQEWHLFRLKQVDFRWEQWKFVINGRIYGKANYLIVREFDNKNRGRTGRCDLCSLILDQPELVAFWRSCALQEDAEDLV